MIKIAEAEKKIYLLWRTWDGVENKYSNEFGYTFYSWLRNHYPELQSFRCKGDKYHIINAWLKEWQDLRSMDSI